MTGDARAAPPSCAMTSTAPLARAFPPPPETDLAPEARDVEGPAPPSPPGIGTQTLPGPSAAHRSHAKSNIRMTPCGHTPEPPHSGQYRWILPCRHFLIPSSRDRAPSAAARAPRGGAMRGPRTMIPFGVQETRRF